MNETIDDLTVQFEENGQVIVNELDKVVLSKGAWTTILFRYQQWQPGKTVLARTCTLSAATKRRGANTASSPNSTFPARIRPARLLTP